MVRLALILHLFIGATLSGMAVIASLVTGHDSAAMLLLAAGTGFILAVPVSAIVARRLCTRT